MRRVYVYSSLLLVAACSQGGAQGPASAPAATATPAASTSAQPAAGYSYTSDEYKALTLCVAMSDTALRVAQQKLDGVPQATVRNFYADKPAPALNQATVDKVYGDTFTSSWDYTLGFFGECADKMATVPPPRSRFAQVCMQKLLIADVASAHKARGDNQLVAYAHFARFKDAKPVIDAVYTSPKVRAAIEIELWQACMAPTLGP